MMALDHLGVIAARIRTAILKYQTKNDQEEVKTRSLASMDEASFSMHSPESTDIECSRF